MLPIAPGAVFTVSNPGEYTLLIKRMKYSKLNSAYIKGISD